jgi:hypothetical protein
LEFEYREDFEKAQSEVFAVNLSLSAFSVFFRVFSVAAFALVRSAARDIGCRPSRGRVTMIRDVQ